MNSEKIHCTLCKGNYVRELMLLKDFKIQLCKRCNIAFTNPSPSLPNYEQEDFHNKNNEIDRFLYSEDLPYDWKQLIAIQKGLIQQYLTKDANILEIGCGEGILLYELFQLGYKVKGIEASYSAQKRGKKKRLDIQRGYFEELNSRTTYNCIIMSQVLEHMPDLERTLRKIKKLVPDGYLLLTQANYKGLIPKIQKIDWYAWVPDQHYWHFTLNGLNRLLMNYGFKLVDYKYSSLVHPHNKLYKLAKVVPKWQDQFTVLYKLNY